MNDPRDATLSRGALVALVVGSMVGAGIFTLPAAFGRTTGMLGAFAAFGYWMACCLACLACLMLIKAMLGQFIPAFGDGSTAVAIASGSLMLWGVHALVLRGVKQAAALNTIATVAKTVPIGIFIVFVIFAFRSELFTLNLWGGEEPGLPTVARQARDTMLLTVFVFVGIEGASVYSRYAKKRNDVGIATMLGFLGVLCLLMLVTLLSYGILPRAELAELAALPNPSMAGVMAAVIGPWGLVFISAGLVLSVAGNYLSWTLLAAEVLHSAAKNDTMPSRLGAENAQRVPHIALWLTTWAIQAFLLITWFAEQAFTLALKMTSAMTLLPYLLVAAYGFKLAWTGQTYAGDTRVQSKDRVIGALATLYAAAMLLAGGATFLLLSALLYAPGTWLYAAARREQGLPLFAAPERLLFWVLCVVALAALAAQLSGSLTI